MAIAGTLRVIARGLDKTGEFMEFGYFFYVYFFISRKESVIGNTSTVGGNFLGFFGLFERQGRNSQAQLAHVSHA